MRKIATRLLMLLALLAVHSAAFAQSAGGDWWGVLEVAPGTRLRLTLHIAAGAEGRLSGTLDSLDQNVRGLPLADVTVAGDQLAFRLERPAASFEGRWVAASKSWSGAWRQNGQTWPLVFVAGPAPAAPASAAPQSPAHWSLPSDPEVAGLIDARIAARPGEGIVIGVLDPASRRIVARGPARSAAFDSRTIFEIGSMSKVFTALILADMVAKGEVSLADPAEKYLPAGAIMPQRGGRKITLGDLATHTSGLPRLPDNMPFGNPRDPYADYGDKLLVEFLGRYQLPREIGSQYEYSNLGFGLLGYLLTRAAHTDYATLLKQRITGPLGMQDTVVALSTEQRARFAQGHDQYMRPAGPWTLTVLAGAGAIRSTASDMLIFLNAAMDPGSPIGPAMRLATSSRRPMGSTGRQTGLGWMIIDLGGGREVLFHDGGTGGFRTAIALEPVARRGVVVLTNAAVEPASDDLALHLLVGAPVQPAGPVPGAPPPSKSHTAVTLDQGELDRVVGQYQFATGLTLKIERNGTGLTAQMSGQPTIPIYPEAPLSFFWRAMDAQARFVAGSDGKVSAVVLAHDGGEVSGKRVGP